MTTGTIAELIEGFPDPVLLIDGAQRLVAANTRAISLFEGARTGVHLLSLIRQPGTVSAVQAVLTGAASDAGRYQAHGPVGLVYSVAVIPVALKGARCAMATFRDVTQIEQAERIRSDFVANVSHELRTPLTALSGFIETLQGPAANDAAARGEFLGIMQAEADRMRRLIDDLLSLSRVEESARVRPADPVALVPLIADVITALGPVAERAGASISFPPPDETPIVPGDRDQLFQVFHNLIENAVKYGGGHVSVRLVTGVRQAGVQGAAIRADIADDGPGIDPIHQPRLTERFYRVDNHRARTVGGTGLGLAIVKHITARHRGRLMIDSAPGKGATFSVLLPMG